MHSDQSVIDQLQRYYGRPLEESGMSVAFPGSFVNLGYWQGIPLKYLTEDDRVASQRAMYRRTLENLNIASTDRLLEVACGRGGGSALAFDEFQPAEVHGVDIVPSQVERAKRENLETVTRASGKLLYRQGSATSLPYPNRYFDKVLSVEAMLYFSDLDVFMSELARVTRRPARVALACVFATSSYISSDEWLSLFDESGIARGYSVTGVTNKLTEHGFIDVQAVSIGKDVWLGYKAWIESTTRSAITAQLWHQGYLDRLFDYYIIDASTTR